jgi:hypothetical protein
MLSAVILMYVGYDKEKVYRDLPRTARWQQMQQNIKAVRQTSHCIFQASYATIAATSHSHLYSTTGVFYFLYRYRLSENLPEPGA